MGNKKNKTDLERLRALNEEDEDDEDTADATPRGSFSDAISRFQKFATQSPYAIAAGALTEKDAKKYNEAKVLRTHTMSKALAERFKAMNTLAVGLNEEITKTVRDLKRLASLRELFWADIEEEFEENGKMRVSGDAKSIEILQLADDEDDEED